MVAAVSAVAAVSVAYALATRTKKASKSEVVRGVGEGGQETVTLKHKSGAVCEVYLHGATVTRYATAAKREVLWVSKSAVFDGKKAIRGGIPLVYPQFGPRADARLGVDSMKQHGFARVLKWELSSSESDDDACRATFVLGPSEATRVVWKWPFDFELRYDVSLTARSLRTALTVTNLSDEPFAPQALLHTYYASSVASAAVRGLGAHTFLDQLTGATRVQPDDHPITFRGELDRVYDGGALNAPKTLTVASSSSAVASVLVEASLQGEAFAPDVVVSGTPTSPRPKPWPTSTTTAGATRSASSPAYSTNARAPLSPKAPASSSPRPSPRPDFSPSLCFSLLLLLLLLLRRVLS